LEDKREYPAETHRPNFTDPEKAKLNFPSTLGPSEEWHVTHIPAN